MQTRRCPYRLGMSQFSESTYEDRRGGASFLSLLGIAVGIVAALVSVAMLIAAG
jgi:hypothetical protein